MGSKRLDQVKLGLVLVNQRLNDTAIFMPSSRRAIFAELSESLKVVRNMVRFSLGLRRGRCLLQTRGHVRAVNFLREL